MAVQSLGRSPLATRLDWWRDILAFVVTTTICLGAVSIYLFSISMAILQLVGVVDLSPKNLVFLVSVVVGASPSLPYIIFNVLGRGP
jgi:hypothetical protein